SRRRARLALSSSIVLSFNKRFWQGDASLVRAFMVGSVGILAWHAWQAGVAHAADRFGSVGMPSGCAWLGVLACRRWKAGMPASGARLLAGAKTPAVGEGQGPPAHFNRLGL